MLFTNAQQDQWANPTGQFEMLKAASPVYELLGGPTRDRVRVYAHGNKPEQLKAGVAQGFTAFKTGPATKRRPLPSKSL